MYVILLFFFKVISASIQYLQYRDNKFKHETSQNSNDKKQFSQPTVVPNVDNRMFNMLQVSGINMRVTYKIYC